MHSKKGPQYDSLSIYGTCSTCTKFSHDFELVTSNIRAKFQMWSNGDFSTYGEWKLNSNEGQYICLYAFFFCRQQYCIMPFSKKMTCPKHSLFIVQNAHCPLFKKLIVHCPLFKTSIIHYPLIKMLIVYCPLLKMLIVHCPLFKTLIVDCPLFKTSIVHCSLF